MPIIKLPRNSAYVNLLKVEQIEKGIDTLYFFFNGRVEKCYYGSDEKEKLEQDYESYVELWKDAVTGWSYE